MQRRVDLRIDQAIEPRTVYYSFLNYGKMGLMTEREALHELLEQLNDAQLERVREFTQSLLRADSAGERRWTFDFVKEFALAKVSAQRERAGMEVQVGETTCDGVAKRALWEHPPLNGAAMVSYAVPIPPQLRALRLKFFIGIRDGSELPPDRYVAFRVLVNGWKLWSAVKNSRVWEEYSVVMPESSSDVLRVEFQTDGLGDHRWNWAVWGEPKLVGD